MTILLSFPFSLVDLTQPVHEEIPSWGKERGFSRRIEMDYDQLFRAELFSMRSGIGTHMDAPAHYVPKGKDIAQIPLQNLVVPLVIIRCNASLDPHFMLSKEEIEEFESSFGRIESGSFVLISTGWHRYWLDAEKYRNEDVYQKMHFPGVTAESAEVLLERGVVGLGIDTLSPDGSDYSFPIHKRFLSSGRFLVENIASTEGVPQKGSFIMLMPLKIVGATEAPIRALALVP